MSICIAHGWIGTSTAARLLFPLALFVAISQGQACANVSFAQAPSAYHLSYAVRVTSYLGAPETRSGTLDLAERDGKLLYRLAVDGRPAKELVFDGANSYFGIEGSGGFMLDGFRFRESPVPIYLPFNFHCFHIYDAFSGKSGENVLFATGQKGILAEQSGYALGNVGVGSQGFSLVDAPKSAPRMKASYADFRNVNGFVVPGEFTFETCKQRAVPGGTGATSDVAMKYVGTLISAGQDYSSNPELDFHQYLKTGMIISYSGPNGSAGVMVDPAKHTFEDELKRQLGFRNAVIPNVKPVTRPWLAISTWVPVGLAAIFGVISIVLLGLSRWRQR